MMDALSDALKLLPHGPEFRFIDRLVALDPGKSGVGEYTVRGDEPFLRGHFPNQPLMPGVLLIEGAAQLAGTVAQSDPQIPPMRGLKLTAIRGAKILGAVQPGETIRFEVKNSGKTMHEMVLGTMQDLTEHAELMRKHPGMEHDEPYMAHVPPGKTERMVWHFTKSGEFYYGCLIPGHFEAGMVGKVIIR